MSGAFFKSIERYLPSAILGVCVCVLFYQYRHYFEGGALAAEDIGAHAALAGRYLPQWLSGNLSFYDRAWFSGWPAFQFYSPLSHVVIGLASIPLSLVYADPLRGAAQASAALSCLLLPLLVYFASRPFASGVSGETPERSSNPWLLALSSSFFSIWFLAHDEQFYGIGAGAVLRVGLFSQAFGWLLLLFYIGLLGRVLAGEGGRFRNELLSITCALLFLTHALSAVYCFLLGAVFWLWSAEKRRELFFSHLVGFLLASVWIIPFFAFSGTFASGDPYPPQGELLSFLFRYPFKDFFALLVENPSAIFTKLNPSFLLLAVALLCVPLQGRLRSSPLLVQGFVSVFILSIFLSSSFIAASLPLGFHYYRFNGYLVLSLLPLLAVVPSAANRSWTKALWAAAMLICVVATLNLPTLEHIKVMSENDVHQGAAVRQELFAYLRERPAKGRVLVEFLNDYKKTPFLSAHEIEAELFAATSRESVGGLFIESSLSHRFTSGSVSTLGGRSFHSYFVFTKGDAAQEFDAVERLRAAGVSHVVAGTSEFIAAFGEEIASSAVSFGPYSVLELELETPSMLEEVQKPVVAYLDLKGSLPFRFVSFYFFSRDELWKEYELIEVSSVNEVPIEAEALMVNAEVPDLQRIKSSLLAVPLLGFRYTRPQRVSHYRRNYPVHDTTEAYQASKRFLEKTLLLEERLSQRVERNLEPEKESEVTPVLSWGSDGQELSFEDLKLDTFYRLNYSYFPLWEMEGGDLYRAGAERMLFTPRESQVHLRYRLWQHPSSWLGCLISLIAGVFLIRSFRASRSPL